VGTTFKMEGFEEFKALIDEIVADFSAKDAKGILKNGMKKAMLPVLTSAQFRAPVDTGALEASLRIEARAPNAKDRRSRYYVAGQVMVAYVTTAPGNKLAQVSYYDRKMIDKTKNTRTTMPYKSIGMKSDARANVQEFGSPYFPAQPYMRISLESNADQVLRSLGDDIGSVLEKYRAKQNRSSK